MVPIKKLNLIEKRTREQCQNCQGNGCSVCHSKNNRFKIYAAANIPISYWNLAFKDFQGDPRFKEIISKKISDIDSLYEEGKSYAFNGLFGTGKTYASCCLLKTALVAGYAAKYYTMSELIQEIINDHEGQFIHNILITDFLCIDEYSSRWVFPSEKSEQLFGQNLEYILRTRFQNQLPTIICSNDSNVRDVLAGEFARPLDSLFSQHLEVIGVAGKDFRKGNK